ncbi:MAG: competence/damage-inducible protein A [Alphaproteobacteria bacterium]
MVKTVGFIVIGDEILNGRTADKNINTIAKAIDDYGFDLVEVRIIGDIHQTIVETVKHLSSNYDYVFTSGGIGGTHDDITFECVAESFGLGVEQNQVAFDRLNEYYQAKNLPLTDTRLNLTKMPIGCGLIDNPISIAPGAIVENVYVCAGIPKIFSAMIENVMPTLSGGQTVYKQAIFKAGVGEGTIGDTIAEFSKKYEQVSIGSYPKFDENGFSTEIIIRSRNKEQLDLCYNEVKKYLDEF